MLAACNTTETVRRYERPPSTRGHDLARREAQNREHGPGRATSSRRPGAAQRAIDAIVREIGPRPVRYVNIYDSYVILETQDPAKPENIDRSPSGRTGRTDSSL